MKPYQSTLPGPKGLPAELERFFWKNAEEKYLGYLTAPGKNWLSAAWLEFFFDAFGLLV